MTDADFADMKDEDLDWQYVNENVPHPVDLVYFGVSRGVFNLGPEISVQAHTSQIASLNDPSNFANLPE